MGDFLRGRVRRTRASYLGRAMVTEEDRRGRRRWLGGRPTRGLPPRAAERGSVSARCVPYDTKYRCATWHLRRCLAHPVRLRSSRRRWRSAPGVQSPGRWLTPAPRSHGKHRLRRSGRARPASRRAVRPRSRFSCGTLRARRRQTPGGGDLSANRPLGDRYLAQGQAVTARNPPASSGVSPLGRRAKDHRAKRRSVTCRMARALLSSCSGSEAETI